jgi:hypothetical protein
MAIRLERFGRWNAAVVGLFLAPLGWFAAQASQDHEAGRPTPEAQEAAYHLDPRTCVGGISDAPPSGIAGSEPEIPAPVDRPNYPPKHPSFVPK